MWEAHSLVEVATGLREGAAGGASNAPGAAITPRLEPAFVMGLRGRGLRD